jgi:hypothetical protein
MNKLMPAPLKEDLNKHVEERKKRFARARVGERVGAANAKTFRKKVMN